MSYACQVGGARCLVMIIERSSSELQDLERIGALGLGHRRPRAVVTLHA
jgi:hypothetical protein